MKLSRKKLLFLLPLSILLPALYFLLALPSEPSDHSHIDTFFKSLTEFSTMVVQRTDGGSG